MSLIERIQWLDAAIRSRQYPNPDVVADHFGVSRRTAQSDYAHLRDNLGAPTAFDRERGGWYYTEKTFALTSLVITAGQQASLHMAVLAAREMLGDHDAALLEKMIASAVPVSSPSPISVESIHGATRLNYDISAAAELIEDCRLAIRERCRIRMRYYAAGNGEELVRVVRPYHLMNHLGERHLIAWCETRRALRQFFVGRIREYTLLPQKHSYNIDPDFDPEEYRRGFLLRHGEALVTVRIRFSPYQARWIRERVYHETQMLEELKDGGVIFSAQVAGTSEIRRWVLGYGSDAEVLEPESLRTELSNILKNLSNLYRATAE